MPRFRAMPYAKALHDTVWAQAPQRVEQVGDELELVAAAFAQVPQLARVMVTPMVSVETKTRILDQVLAKLAVEEPSLRFLHVLRRHYRLAELPQILIVYRKLVDRALGRTHARVEVATPLGPAQREATVAAIAGLVGTEVVAEFVERPDLLAGFKVQVGSKILDGSLLAQVERLSRQNPLE